MAIVGPFERFVTLQTTKRFGLPNGYGQLIAGWGKYGYFNPYAGYYQRRRGVKGEIIVRTKFYKPQNPDSEAQLLARAKWASGVSAWHGLDESQKQFYRDLQYPTHQSGFNRFMARYMKDEI